MATELLCGVLIYVEQPKKSMTRILVLFLNKKGIPWPFGLGLYSVEQPHSPVEKQAAAFVKAIKV